MAGIEFQMNATGNLAQSLDNVKAKSDQTDAAMRKLDERLKKFRSTSTLVKSQFGGMENAFKSLKREAQASTQTVARSAEAMETTVSRVTGRAGASFSGMFKAIGGRANRAALQNTAFQLQDITTQLEMGVSWNRTLAQQLPQLTGGFGAYGAAIGVAVGAFFALLPLMSKALNLMVDLDKEIKETVDSLDRLEELEKSFSDVIRDQADAYDLASEAARRFFEQREELAKTSVQDSTRGLLGGMIAPEMVTTQTPGLDSDASFMDRFWAIQNAQSSMGMTAATKSPTGRNLLAVDADALSSNDSGLTTDQSAGAASILSDMADKELRTRKQIVEAYLEAETSMREMGLTQEQINKVTGDMVEELGLVEELAANVAQEYKEVKDRQEVLTDGLSAVKDIWTELSDRVKDTSSYINEQSTAMTGQERVAQALERHGKDSAAYAEVKAKVAREEYEATLANKGLAQDVVSVLSEQFAATQKVKGETSEAQKLMAILEQNAWGVKNALDQTNLGHLIGQVDSLIAKVPGIASSFFSAWGHAASRTAEGKSMMNRADYLENGPKAGDAVKGGRGHAIPDAIDSANAGNGGIQLAPYKASKGGGGGGTKSIGEQVRDFWSEQNQVIDQMERMLGVYGRQREVLEEQASLEEDLFSIKGKLSENDKTRIADLAEQITLIEERDQKEQSMYETLDSSIEGFLNSAVQDIDNIEDAFSGMLQNILMEVWKQEVSKPITNAVLSLFSANGNAFNASGVTAHAKGDVFGSPTLFSYGSGKTGVMGEAGPEAVMPLKRGKDGKLGVATDSGGGGGGTTVNQYFNFSANGDESVQRIIDQNIPRISQAGVQSMISMRKSGKLRGTF